MHQALLVLVDSLHEVDSGVSVFLAKVGGKGGLGTAAEAGGRSGVGGGGGERHEGLGAATHVVFFYELAKFTALFGGDY